MVRWYHAIFSAYGFWLPNDPRGCWSDFVHSYELYKFGGAPNTVSDKRSYAHDEHDVRSRRDTKEHLKYPPVRFEDAQRISIAKGIAQSCEESDITIFACAIGYDHIRAVVARHKTKSIEEIVRQFKARATMQMNCDGCHPMQRYQTRTGAPNSPWSVGLWSVFIDETEQLIRAVQYVEQHPMKEGLPPQRWSFVKTIDKSV